MSECFADWDGRIVHRGPVEVHRAGPIDVSPEELAEMSANSGQQMDLPAGRAGWAHLDVAGKTYRAWLLAPVRRVTA